MFISIKKDGSIYIESSSFIASYNEKGKLNYIIGGGLSVPEFININDHREKKSPNPDKNESPVKPIKITVDSIDLDKLETQLKRIEGLMVSAGLKQPASVGFSADKFFIASGQVFINETLVTSGTITSAKVQGPAIDDALRQAAEKGAIEGAEQTLLRVTTGVNYDREQLSSVAKLDDTDREIKEKETDAAGILNGISEALHNSGNKAVIAALDKVIDINPPVSREELKKHKQYVEAGLDEMQSQLIGFQHALVASEQSTAQHLSGLQRQITQLNKQLEDARCKESINNMSIISLKQTIEQQEKSLAETIKRMIAEDLCRGGTLSRML
ncbi:hypothetical protein AB7Y92_03985 [Providencia manganoxydans]|uniref:hypothetical protein n=1 Tax=Providencia manganoxydans TaxID=2923283 RepID=UPI0034E412BF